MEELDTTSEQSNNIVSEEERNQNLEAAVEEVLQNFDLEKLGELRAEYGKEDFNYDGNQILNELVQELQSNLMHKYSTNTDVDSISNAMEDLEKLHQIYDDVDFKSVLLLALKK